MCVPAIRFLPRRRPSWWNCPCDRRFPRCLNRGPLRFALRRRAGSKSTGPKHWMTSSRIRILRQQQDTDAHPRPLACVSASVVQRFMDENRLPHLLFYGPPGTGKTSTVLACAKRLYGPQWKTMVLEVRAVVTKSSFPTAERAATATALSAAAVQLNASDDRGIDVVREQIRNFASTRKMFSSGFKMIILDEADSMTQAAQTALRRGSGSVIRLAVIEKFTRNVRFCLICNYVSKIIPALQSRCTRFRFAPLEREQVMSRLDHVIESERYNIALSV
ncbi:MAG: P-loop containing nucleoside triphosphate hydrolase protein [Olpidium bornovanus]|uniref:P-loop containing nucleoside triphosphate hydrolase protein n=1 Tax=Olpidium bornovanus TaxID=278681 RepID=A0A8H8DI65_9FUNG|nr:MAG: P-loop containing nucleoside triphosphate hydrolase protein [Olpidium bornovanus]